jgi:hypothetical protein
MSGRRRRRVLRDTEIRAEMTNRLIVKPPDQTRELLRADNRDEVQIGAATISRINAIAYINQYYPQLQNFLGYFHTRFYEIIDMITAATDITVIIAAAKSLRSFIATHVENLQYLPGAESLVVALGRCETILLDIIQDLIDGVELLIVRQRVNYMRELLIKIDNSYKD